MPIKDFTQLDAAIVRCIREGRATTFTAITYDKNVEALYKPLALRTFDDYRVVDRRLQALRKKGVLKYEKGKWNIVNSTRTGTEG